MNKTVYKSTDRGFANHGWLKTHHSFSFANYYDENRMGFGMLRVLNDDFVEPGMGFGTHPHDNMEIISIPLRGTMAHKDSQGNEFTIKEGDVQVMSAGSGLTHSEYNYSRQESLNFLQIWIFPNVYNTPPFYKEKSFEFPQGKLVLTVSPEGTNGSLPIKQDAYLYLGRFTRESSFEYTRKSDKNGIFLFVIEGKLSVAGESLHKRDAMEIENSNELDLYFEEDAHMLLIEVPMEK